MEKEASAKIVWGHVSLRPKIYERASEFASQPPIRGQGQGNLPLHRRHQPRSKL